MKSMKNKFGFYISYFVVFYKDFCTMVSVFSFQEGRCLSMVDIGSRER